ncbi:MAG: hypothetical protein ACXWT4_06315, partial [Methylobacter sp.]
MIEAKKLPQFSDYINTILSDTKHHVVRAGSGRNKISLDTSVTHLAPEAKITAVRDCYRMLT